jgi:hypothetical protein
MVVLCYDLVNVPGHHRCRFAEGRSTLFVFTLFEEGNEELKTKEEKVEQIQQGNGEHQPVTCGLRIRTRVGDLDR